VLIDNERCPRICDFGLSHFFLEEESSGYTTTTEHTGTDRYLAYELVVGTSDTIIRPTTQSDIWALGCIGLEVRLLYLSCLFFNNRDLGYHAQTTIRKAP
jgi:serine/threonine protein kinase